MVRMYSTALTPKSVLLAWYDRDPISRSLSYNAAGVAPHGATVRATYTVPSGKKAFISASHSLIRRATVATTAGLVYAETLATGLMVLIDFHENNTAGYQSKREILADAVAVASDQIQIVTADPSTGGTMDYWIYTTITEFNA